MFCGPTGVGKTQLAKALSRYFFGHGEKQDRLVRLDMSEYGGFDAGHTIARVSLVLNLQAPGQAPASDSQHGIDRSGDAAGCDTT